jgi:hypothetical protein
MSRRWEVGQDHGSPAHLCGPRLKRTTAIFRLCKCELDLSDEANCGPPSQLQDDRAPLDDEEIARVRWHVWFFDKTGRGVRETFSRYLSARRLWDTVAKRRSVSGLPCCRQLKTAKSH